MMQGIPGNNNNQRCANNWKHNTINNQRSGNYDPEAQLLRRVTVLCAFQHHHNNTQRPGNYDPDDLILRRVTVLCALLQNNINNKRWTIYSKHHTLQIHVAQELNASSCKRILRTSHQMQPVTTFRQKAKVGQQPQQRTTGRKRGILSSGRAMFTNDLLYQLKVSQRRRPSKASRKE